MQNHPEDCHIYWFDVFELLRSDYGVCCTLCNLSDQILWIGCVTLTAALLSIIVDIEREISNLAVSVNFSNGVTVPVEFHSERSYDSFVIHGGIVRTSSVRTDWGFAVVSLEAVFTCIVKCGKCMRLCVCVDDHTVVPRKTQPYD